MADWRKSMQQTFEYYSVNPGTWKDDTRINTIKSCTINRDSEVETLGSASFEVTESIGECYIRVYLVTIQNGVTERHPLGTFLVQTPSTSFNGKIRSVTLDAYTPLLELKENQPPIGYSLLKGENIMDTVYRLCREHARAPVVPAICDETLQFDFVANSGDTWLTFIIDLAKQAKYALSLDEMGRILFSPKQDTASLQSVWTYDDGNSSILYPDLTMNHDIFGIPNVVEVVYSSGMDTYYAKAVNNDPNSPISTINRGRAITHRVVNPDMIGEATQKQIQEYAEQTLRDLSALEYKINYSHGYCPVRIGDGIRANYSRAGINGVRAKVISQSISCVPGTPVSETAVFSNKLWG